MRLYPQVALPAEAVEQWNKVLMPQVDNALRSFYRKNAKETVEISLESIGESASRTQPTVLVICTSVNKVRHILRRKLGALFDGPTGFALKVCQGRVVRSRNPGVQRSMAKHEEKVLGAEEVLAVNGEYQDRPQPGASIGAWIGDRHLPPVTFGGLIVVDDKPYGMTVHHMLDDPEQVQRDTRNARQENQRSMADESVMDLAAWYAESQADADSTSSEDFACEFDSESDSALSESAVTTDYESEASDEQEHQEEYTEAGDIPGIEPGCGDGYIVTQPALDDVPDSFYPSEDTMNEDHLSSYTLGDVYASSGIRRKADATGLIHEIDWALFEFNDDRMPDNNDMPNAQQALATDYPKPGLEAIGNPHLVRPMSVAPMSMLPGLEVQCIARTSGLQTGLILPALTSVKIYGRTSPSHTYQVSGAPAVRSELMGGRRRAMANTPNQSNRAVGDSKVPAATSKERRLPLGIPGDSGAWIVDCEQAQLCGHVLAWSQRKRVAYICPMEMLLQDIVETLEASDIRLPGSATIVSSTKLATSKGLRQPARHPVHPLSVSSRTKERASDFLHNRGSRLGDLVRPSDTSKKTGLNASAEEEDSDWEDDRLMGTRTATATRRFDRPLPRYSEHDESPEPSPPDISRESTFGLETEADDNVSVATETEPPLYESKSNDGGRRENRELVNDLKGLKLPGASRIGSNRVVDTVE
jgi:hypothetical protein